MTDTEKKEYEELKSLLYAGQISQYGKRKLIEIVEKQDTEINKLNNIIDRMAEYIAPLKTKDGVKWTEIGVKEYFMKKERRREYE